MNFSATTLMPGEFGQVILEPVDAQFGQIEAAGSRQHCDLALAAELVGNIGGEKFGHDVGRLADKSRHFAAVRRDAVVDHGNAGVNRLLDDRNRAVRTRRHEHDAADLALNHVLDLRNLPVQVAVTAGVVDLDVVSRLLARFGVAAGLQLEIGIAGRGQHDGNLFLALCRRHCRCAGDERRCSSKRQNQLCGDPGRDCLLDTVHFCTPLFASTEAQSSAAGGYGFRFRRAADAASSPTPTG